MVSTTQPKKADSAQICPIIPTGGDVGAGQTKLVMDGGNTRIRVKIPSQIVELKEVLVDNYHSKLGSQFAYLAGDRTDLIGHEFLVGDVASWHKPETHLKLSDDPALKAEYALHALLGAIGTLPHRLEWHLYLVPSIHDKKTFGSKLLELTKGVHAVSFGGKDKAQSRIKIDIPLVVPEGAGSYYYAKRLNLINPQAHCIGFDFGTSTIIPVPFTPGGKIIRHQPLSVSGCIALLEAIANDSELKAFIGTGKAASVDLIRQSIESGTFTYTVSSRSGVSSFNFKPVYHRHLTPWLTDRIRLAFKAMDEWRNSAQSLIAWGGGVEMPSVSQALKSIGIESIPDGSYANAIGLQAIAATQLVKRI